MTHIAEQVRSISGNISDFVKFCFRDDIAKQLEKVQKPHILAVKLYENETGIKISTQTAYRQRDKWIMINGEIVKA